MESHVVHGQALANVHVTLLKTTKHLTCSFNGAYIVNRFLNNEVAKLITERC